MRTDVAQTVRLEDYRPTAYAIGTVDLDIRLAPKATRVNAKIAFSPREGTAPGTALELAGDELKLVGLTLNGAPLSPEDYEVGEDTLTIKTPPEGPFVLEIVTEIDPDANSKLMGLYRSSGTYCTQCEAEGFRRITYFYDRPDVLAVYTTRIEARKSDAPILLANGNPVEAGDIEGTDRHYAVWHDPFPKPSYLFAMVAGDLACVSDTYRTLLSGREVELRIYVEHGNETRCDYAMDALKRSMRWDEEVFGREYDLDIFMIVAVSDFNMGAMENKGLNVFNDKYVLANPETATDQDYAGIEGVIAHEYFHNWTGDRITCRDWFQLCLKEGLTVFRDQEFSSDMRSRAVKRIADVRLLQSHQFPEDGGPLAHPVRPTLYRQINNFYTATVYEKGAEIVRMLKTLLGVEGFRAGMDLYFDRHDGEAATIEDFIKCFEDANEADLSQFARWYAQAGTPALKVAEHWDEASKSLRIDIEQSCQPTPGQTTKLPFTIPVRFGLIGPNGADMEWTSASGAELRDDVIILTDPRHSITFEGLSSRPVTSLLRGFSAPVRLADDKDRDALVFLARHDSDPFNRWHAVQSLAMQLLKRGARTPGALATDEIQELASLIGEAAGDGNFEPALRAQLLQLPAESDIARELGTDVDPDAIAAARKAVQVAIAGHCAESFAILYEALADTGPYSPDAEAAGRRALRLTVLEYLAWIDGEASVRTLGHYRTANNMSDRLTALRLLVHRADAGAQEALDDFEARFAKDALVMDKWLTVQATAPFPETLARIRTLTAHPTFSYANPNRIRALIGAFAAGNQTQFNRPDGAGFDFVADTVLSLDKRNPQVAARLLSAFRSWRALEPGRRALAEAALRRVAEAGGLSSDVQDIATRSLQ
ncbi:aminopeptidase N [Breoghania corrubedonensis]|uniref:Aminopeptidase N n=1 Tax=Breoghania corrubedonensis TaxID=665038 RepID=A0A2T5V1K3_9HYPH|nr:aminopeptidase N [Breoghania corrubedonensis]PTW57622.1 aminopeptidase N [Breoghania corrubedonensis]